MSGLSWKRKDEDELPLRHMAAQAVVSLLCWTMLVLIGVVCYRISQIV